MKVFDDVDDSPLIIFNMKSPSTCTGIYTKFGDINVEAKLCKLISKNKIRVTEKINRLGMGFQRRRTFLKLQKNNPDKLLIVSKVWGYPFGAFKVDKSENFRCKYKRIQK